MKNLLKELNMTIRQFSEKYEIPYNTVRQWERGLNSPPKYVMNLLSEKIDREKNGEQISFDNLVTLHIKTKMNEWEQIADNRKEAENSKLFWESQGASVTINIYKKL